MLLIFITLLVQDYYPDRLLVCFKPSIELATINQTKSQIITGLPSFDKLCKEHGIYKIERWLTSADQNDHWGNIYLSKIYRLYFSKKENVKEIALKFEENENLIYAEPEPVCHPYYAPNDSLYSLQWHLVQVKAPEAWDLWDIPNEYPCDTSIIIGIIDDGVDWHHPDLIDNIWQNSGEDADGDGHTIEYIGGEWVFDPGDLNGVDNDSNGYVDDLIGYDLADGNNNPEPSDSLYAGHGTAVAGVASAVTNNEIGVASVAWKARLMPVKCSYDTEPGYIPYGYAGILYAAKAGANIINCSWGSTYGGSAGQAVVNVAHDSYGAIICASAGHDVTSEPKYPAAYKNVIAVTATTIGDIKWGCADYGDWIDCCAPGTNIWTTVPDSGYASLDGISLSSALVAGCYGLLWAWYRDSSNIWIEQELLDNCDNIDSLNPLYAGQLGYGRVNIYKAIANNILPNLSYISHTVIETEGDGDSIINPDESAEVRILVKNEAGWSTAYGVTGKITSPDSAIIITDSIASYNDIHSGSIGINIKPFKFQISSDAGECDIPLTLILSANQTTPYPYSVNISFEIEVSMNQIGWPVDISSQVSASPIIIDIDNDGEMEVIAGDHNGRLWVWNKDASVYLGFPFNTGDQIRSSSAIGDVDGNGDLEIVFGSKDMNLYIVNHDASLLLKFRAKNYITGTPVLKDLNKDGDLEIIFGDYSGNLYVINHDSTLFKTFPYSIGEKIYSGAGVGDVDGDSIFDIVVGTYGHELYVISSNGNVLFGWPQEVGGSIHCAPSLADLDNDGKLEIVCGSDDGKLYVFNCQGVLLDTIQTGNRIRSSPSFCDIDKDGNVEIFFGSDDGNLYGIHCDGSPVAGFPYSTGAEISSSPVFSDINGDGYPEIVFASQDGKVYALDRKGVMIKSFPISTKTSIKSSPCIADLDKDGDLEIAIGNGNGVEMIDFSLSPGTNNYWNMYRGNPYRTGNYVDVVIGIEEEEIKKLQNAKLEVCPNPFGLKTVINYRMPVVSRVSLKIYNVSGKLVKILVNERKEPGYYTVRWNTKEFSSGVYFAKFITGNYKTTKKLILLK
ncbi:S8 family serine peptidase [candidate division WOR-3 bacterium]|nr:S8 family serine peptidase [candidate division WOR-3 bacterium]